MKTSFRQYAELKGIDLMREDIKFLKLKLPKIASYAKRGVLERYAEEWVLGMRETEIVYRKQNCGRRRANNYILSLENV
jgi:hypothetical protein